MDWFVRESALSTTGRTGGINALKGFEFQKSYAVWLLTKLLTGEDEIAVVRYEGAQDVDLMLSFETGRTKALRPRHERAVIDTFAMRGVDLGDGAIRLKVPRQAAAD